MPPTDTSTSSPPRRRASEAERRAQILAAAEVVAVRDRLDGLTARAVAEEAGVSSGLVFVYFTNKDGLLLALLDRVIERTITADPAAVTPAAATARDRLLGAIRHELLRVHEQRDLIELFLDFWMLGMRDAAVRQRIRTTLRAYRSSLQPLVADVINEEPARFASTDAPTLSGVIASFVFGNAVQAVMEPGSLDIDGLLGSVEALVPPPGTP